MVRVTNCVVLSSGKGLSKLLILLAIRRTCGIELVIKHARLCGHKHLTTTKPTTVSFHSNGSVTIRQTSKILCCIHLCSYGHLLPPVFFHVISRELLDVAHLIIKRAVVITTQMGAGLTEASLIAPARVVPLVGMGLRVDLPCDRVRRGYLLRS